MKFYLLMILFTISFNSFSNEPVSTLESYSKQYTTKQLSTGVYDEKRPDFSKMAVPDDAVEYNLNRRPANGNNRCKRLRLVEDLPELLIMLNSNDGFLIPSQPLQINPPPWAKCVLIYSLAAMETRSALLSTTTAGAQYTHPISGLKMASNKVLNRGGFLDLSDENMTSIVLPLDATGNIYFQQLNLRNPNSAADTLTGLIITLGGFYY